MGIIILIVAFVMEVVFAAYCIVMKSNQMRIRSIVYTSALAVFAILALVPVLEWSTRWYG
jgi:hypothetical protein